VTSRQTASLRNDERGQNWNACTFCRYVHGNDNDVGKPSLGAVLAPDVSDVQSTNSFRMNWWSQDPMSLVILGSWAPAPTAAGHWPMAGAWSVSGLGLLRALRGQRRRHSCLVPQPLATLSSRDASRSARRKRTGCVEPYDQGPPARPRYRRGPSTLKGQGRGWPQEYRSFEGIEHFWARMAEGVDDSSKDFIKSTDEGSILEVATFFD